MDDLSLVRDHTVLSVVVGSRAYGLATETSDVDRRGVYAAPTPLFWGFTKPPTHVDEPDAERFSWELERFLGLALAAAYAPALHGQFVWDDNLHVTENPTIVGPLGLKEIWTTARANYFPLVLTHFWLVHAWFGLDTLPYHLTTLACHALAALVLWRVLVRLRVPGAWLGAALWALHPVQVESVAWICELKNTQSAVFFFAAVWCWLRWLERQSELGTETPLARAPGRGAVFYAGALACAVAAARMQSEYRKS